MSNDSCCDKSVSTLSALVVCGALTQGVVSFHTHTPLSLLSHASSLPCWVPRLKLVGSLASHAGCVNTIHWNSNGDFLISGSDDTTVRQPPPPAPCLLFLPRGCWSVLKQRASLQLKIWDMARLKKVVTLTPGHSDNVFRRALPSSHAVAPCDDRMRCGLRHTARNSCPKRARSRWRLAELMETSS